MYNTKRVVHMLMIQRILSPSRYDSTHTHSHINRVTCVIIVVSFSLPGWGRWGQGHAHPPTHTHTPGKSNRLTKSAGPIFLDNAKYGKFKRFIAVFNHVLVSIGKAEIFGHAHNCLTWGGRFNMECKHSKCTLGSTANSNDDDHDDDDHNITTKRIFFQFQHLHFEYINLWD